MKFVFALVLIFLSASAISKKRAMVWMCLERCGDDAQEIQKQVDILRKKAPSSLTGVSFELYNLGPDSSLVINDLTPVYEKLQGLKNVYGDRIDLIPMISSYPYPPEFIDYMRTLFKNPDPFINKCIEEAEKFNFNGFNVDFEPTKGIEEGDDQLYADFLTYFSDKLHEKGLVLTVDVARWTTLWNYPLLSKTTTDMIINMNTYTYNWTTWEGAFDYAIENVDKEKLDVGLCCNCGGELEKEDIQKRFKKINEKDVQGVDIWRLLSTDMYETSEYWIQLEKFFEKN